MILTIQNVLVQCIVLNDVMLDKINVTKESCILALYLYSICKILLDSRFEIKNTNLGLDVIANVDIKKGNLLWKPTFIFEILPKSLIKKYAAYIYKDCYIIDGFGMILNNIDKEHKENCNFNESTKYFISTASIKQGDSIRWNYNMKTDDYPPIPKEIISLRSMIV